MKFSATTVVLAGGLGLVLGTMMNGRVPDVALAQAAQVAAVLQLPTTANCASSSLALILTTPSIAAPAWR